MCNFVSFFVSVKKNALACGNPYSHDNAVVHSGMGDWREAEWTQDGLTVRVDAGEDASVYLATVRALAPTREALCDRLSPSRDLDCAEYYFSSRGYHRDGDMPAVTYANGTVEYWRDGKRHRDGDLPAIIYADGAVEYWQDGLPHRDGDMPAVIYADGGVEYWRYGKEYIHTSTPPIFC